MSAQGTVPPSIDGTELMFLRQLQARIDDWCGDRTHPDGLARIRDLLHQRLRVCTDTARLADIDADPVIALFAVELHRLRRAAATATITTVGGHRHDRVRVHGVHRHHTVIGHALARGVLLPLRFIESITPHDQSRQ
ncbi:hypothetical protein AB0J47_40010 [Nocardia sp. NPDC049737]|uniref:hypothetical protein n=1 Tax=Nocardia sp. NPDC049737 TaxID=3154358 RepID=UPI00343415E2